MRRIKRGEGGREEEEGRREEGKERKLGRELCLWLALPSFSHCA